MIVASWMFEFTISDVTFSYHLWIFKLCRLLRNRINRNPRLHKCKHSILFCMVKLALMYII